MATSSQSLSRQAYRRLEQLIVTLQLAPGSLVTERELIDLAGQGRTPVREAVQKLEWQGLIQVRPRVGLQISQIRSEDHANLMAVRRQLEPMAAGLVAQHAGESDREALAACADAMRQAVVTADIEAFLQADKQFDELAEACCPNPFLTATLAPLQTHARRTWFAGATVEKMQHSAQLHLSVIAAIREADAPSAEAAMIALVDTMTKQS